MPTCGSRNNFAIGCLKKELLQVTNFFYLSATNSFWGNLSPDRLYELEQLIMKKLELPYKLQETYIKDDFLVGFLLKILKKQKNAEKEQWKLGKKRISKFEMSPRSGMQDG